MVIKVSTLLAHNTLVQDDLNPILGGNLDTGGFSISNPFGLPPSVNISGNNYPYTTGTAGQVLTTNGAGTLSWTTNGTGTVTSVGVSSIGTYASALTIGSSPVTSSGTITITPHIFTAVAPGVVPASGGSTTAFLRADGIWVAAPGTGTVTSVGVTSSSLDITGTNPVTTTGTIGVNLPTIIAAGSFTNANISIDIHGRIVAASNGSGGGVTQLVAGTNITLSPPTGLGVVTINSTGGGLTGGALNQIPVMTGPTTNTYITAPTSPNTFLEWNGSSFIWSTAAGMGTVTSVGLTSSASSITVSGAPNPITSSGTFNVDLPLSGVTASTYGSASAVGVFTVNSRGITTSATTTPISITPTQAGLGNVVNSLQVINNGGAPSIRESTGAPVGADIFGAIYIDQANTGSNSIYFYDGAIWQVIGQKLNLYNENFPGFIAPTASAATSVALGSGAETQLGADGSLAIGLQSLARNQGGVVQASGRFSSNGDAQTGKYLLRGTTINSTPAELLIDGSGGSVRLILTDDSTWTFRATITGHRTDVGDGHAGYTVLGVIYRGSGAATTAIQGAINKTVIGESDSAWDISVTADTTNGALKITVTGETGKIIRWLAMVETVEVTN